MKKPITIIVLILLLLAIAVSVAILPATTTARLYYTKADGTETYVESDPCTVYILERPTVAGVPASAVRGTVSTLTVSGDIGDEYYSYRAFLPTPQSTYVSDTLSIEGTTGRITSVETDGIWVELDPVEIPATIKCHYQVRWGR